MKKAWFVLLLVAGFYGSGAQTWVRKNDFPGHARLNPIHFIAGNQGYLGYGKQLLLSGEHADSIEIWRYNPPADLWIAVNAIPMAETGSEAFNIGDSAYVRTGGHGGIGNNHFYKYEPGSDSWTLKAQFPADTLFNAASFSLQKQGYITGGSDTNSRPQHHTYCYNPVLDSWTEKDTLPLALNGPCGATAGGYGFIAMGIRQGNFLSKRLFRYDSAGLWSEQSPFPGSGFATRSCQFVWNKEIYFCLDSFQCWKYVPGTDQWFKLPNTPFNGAGTCFVLNNIPYVIENGTKQVWQWCPPLSLSISTTKNICKGDSAQLSVSGGIGFSWSPAAGLNNPTISNPHAAPTDSTLYHVLVTDLYGCKGTDSIRVNVMPLPSIHITNSRAAICKGDTTTLSASGGFAYNWLPVWGLSNASIGNPIASPAAPTRYTVTASDLAGCRQKDSVFINVFPLPNIPVQAFPPSLCRGNRSKLSAQGNDTTLHYFWRPFSHLSDSTGFSVDATPLSTQTYTLVAADTLGCKGSTTITLWVHALPVITPAVNPAVLCAGDTALLSAGGASVYSWSPAGSLDGTGQSVHAFPASTTLYTVTGLDSNHCQSTSSVLLSVNPLPAQPHLGVNMLLLSSDAAFGNQWYLNGLLLPGDTGQTYTAKVNGTYKVCVSNRYGCFSCSEPLAFNAMGTDENTIARSFSVYPNPASETITFQFQSAVELPFKIELYSLQGQKEKMLFEGKSSEMLQNATLNTEGISNGIYIVQLTISDAIYQRKLAVIK